MSENKFKDVPFPSDNQVTRELIRELITRRSVYPKWIAEGKIKPEQAAHRIACLEKAIELLHTHFEQTYGKQATLFPSEPKTQQSNTFIKNGC